MSRHICLSTNHVSNVLIVEDNLTIQLVYQSFLKKLGFQSEIVDSGQQALDRINDRHYCAILLDFGLPDINGDIVIDRIRASEQSSLHHLPIIVTTAHGNAQVLAECKRKGANMVFRKPVSLATFYSIGSIIHCQKPK